MNEITENDAVVIKKESKINKKGKGRQYLTPEEEIKLFHAMKNGETEEIQVCARNKIIDAHMPLIEKMVNIRYPQEVDKKDIIHECVLWLLHAMDYYIPDTKAAFSSYAFLVIKQRFPDYQFNKLKPFRIPYHARKKLAIILRTENTFISQHNRKPSPEELAEKLGISIEQLNKERSYGSPGVSLSTQQHGDSSYETLGDMLESTADTITEIIEKREKIRLVQEILASDIFSDRERRILYLLFEERLILADAGIQLNLSKQAVGQNRVNILEKFEKEWYKKTNLESIANRLFLEKIRDEVTRKKQRKM